LHPRLRVQSHPRDRHAGSDFLRRDGRAGRMAPGTPGDETPRGRCAKKELKGRKPPMAETPRPNIRELESLRIARAEEPRKPSRLLPAAIAIAVLGIVGVVAYQLYTRTIGRAPEVQTAVVSIKQAGQPGTVLTGSGYIVTQHKYITIGTRVLGQIVEEPIEEGQHVKKGQLLARIDDGDYQATLRQANADRELALADIKLYEAQTVRQ